MMFRFIVRYLGLLKHVPLAGHIVDSWMMLWTYAFNPSVLHMIEDIEQDVSTWKDVTCIPHKFGGVQFNVHNKEIGHIHHNGILDILFDRRTKIKLIQHSNVREHHTFKASGWISFYLQSQSDYDIAIKLLQDSYERTKRASGF